MESSQYDMTYNYVSNPAIRLVTGLLNALYLTPLFCHFVFDAYIWKSRHREAKLVFATGAV